MPNPDMRDLVVVTQADREAAASAFPATVETTREAIRLALFDSSAPVQAFARHRIAAEAECAARVERLATFAGLVERRIRHTCDVTKAGRARCVRVPTAEWHGIMALMEAARAALNTKGDAS